MSTVGIPVTAALIISAHFRLSSACLGFSQRSDLSCSIWCHSEDYEFPGTSPCCRSPCELFGYARGGWVCRVVHGRYALRHRIIHTIHVGHGGHFASHPCHQCPLLGPEQSNSTWDFCLGSRPVSGSCDTWRTATHAVAIWNSYRAFTR